MPSFRFISISDDVALEVRERMHAPQYGHPAYREMARGTGPCRLCLRTFQIGKEERILFTYNPFHDEGSLPAPGPIFIHADPCRRYDALELPPDFRALPIVVEGYQTGGRLLIQERVGERVPESVLEQVFHIALVDYVHLRNGEAGCFMARVERVTPGRP